MLNIVNRVDFDKGFIEDKKGLAKTDNFYGFLLQNREGGFFSLSENKNRTRYMGQHFPFFTKTGNNGNYRDEYYKTIERISLKDKECGEIINREHSIIRKYENTTETFFFHNDCILYSVEGFNGYVDIELDFRKMFDFSDKGRIYNIYNENKVVIVEYTKFHDDSLTSVDYKIYLAIAGVESYMKSQFWENKEYDYDKLRGSVPFSLYVYNAMKLLITNKAKIVFSSGLDKNEAIAKAKKNLDNFDNVCESKIKYVRSIFPKIRKNKNTIKNIDNNMLDISYYSSIRALDSLTCEIRLRNDNGTYDKVNGIYAGNPWFFQFWSRDEAISLNALILEGDYDKVIELIRRQLNSMQTNGRIQNRFGLDGLGSADSNGWIFTRCLDLLEKLKKENILERYNADNQLINFISEKLDYSISQTIKNYSSKGLIENHDLETWMDTSYKDDFRNGMMIEIQALFLKMIQLKIFISKELFKKDEVEKYIELEKLYKEQVRSELYDEEKGIVKDGVGDSTIRPNLFIAYYLVPEIFSKGVWKKCFDNVLKELFLDWGGIASIERKHKYYTDYYTGENNKSYHRGDSWYFLNNMTAICLLRLDKRRYEEYISKITNASMVDMLYYGYIGCSSEVSSAKEQQPRGTFSQAWSSAMFIELYYELSR